ncbi:hypothetical protein EMPS_05351 [Entomortierella parvispora]|uniref:Uncharacterized protein n=1 Tax=Entomortierella parvispora TaxID=205924 RepID=A0A9P3HAV2_9FUNG|nr:hypothetical protein EMPS_05351 [Entomortierella parvispora]
MTLDSVPSSPKAHKGCSSVSDNPPFPPILKNGHVARIKDVVIAGFSQDSTAPSTSQETMDTQDVDPLEGGCSISEEQEPVEDILSSPSRRQSGTSKSPPSLPILRASRGKKHVPVPEKGPTATSIRQYATSELWEKHLAFQRDQDSSKKIVRPSLIQVADEDNPFMVTPVVTQRKAPPKSANMNNPFVAMAQAVQRKTRPMVEDEDNPFMVTPEAFQRKARPRVEQESNSFSSASSSLFKVAPLSRMANMESDRGSRSGSRFTDPFVDDQGQNSVGKVVGVEEDDKEKIDSPEVEEPQTPRKYIGAVNPLRIYQRRFSLGSISSSPSVKRGIEPESPMLADDPSEDEDDSNDSRMETILRTPEKKKKWRNFEMNPLFSPGSPNKWAGGVTPPRIGMPRRIPDDDEQTELPPSPLVATSQHVLETPKRKIGRVISRNGSSYDRDQDALHCLGEDQDNEDGFESDIKEDGKYTREQDEFTSPTRDRSNPAMFPSISSTGPWSPRTTPSSKRVKYVYQTPPRKKPPILSPFKKPPGAPRFSFYSGVIEDQDTRYSPAKQKLDRMRRP